MYKRIIELATKRTRKKQNYNRKDLAKKLDAISERVAARGIYIARKNIYDQWDLYDYAHDTVVFDNLPNREIADRIADKYNKNKKYQLTKQGIIKKICTAISKHNTDCIYYLHTIQNSQDSEKIFYTETRLQIAKDHIRELIRELNHTI